MTSGDRGVAGAGGAELAHWGYGAAGGAAFGMLPDAIRRRAWAGPAYGLVLSEIRSRPRE